MDHYDPAHAPDPAEWLALDEDERMLLVRAYHREAGSKMPNRRIHASLHAVVETQAAMGDELPVRRAIQRLMGEGLDRHEAVHAVASVLFGSIIDTANVEDGDEAQAAYNDKIERLTADGWRETFGADDSDDEFDTEIVWDPEDAVDDDPSDNLDDILEDILAYEPEAPSLNPMRHVGRNDPCPCGSGKKYKKCCLRAAE